MQTSAMFLAFDAGIGFLPVARGSRSHVAAPGNDFQRRFGPVPALLRADHTNAQIHSHGVQLQHASYHLHQTCKPVPVTKNIQHQQKI